MAELIKKLADRLERASAGSQHEIDALYEAFEAVSRALHRYELLSIDHLYTELTDPARDAAFLERASEPGSALWALREQLRSFLALFPRPVEPFSRWSSGSFMGQLLGAIAEAPTPLEVLRARLDAPQKAVEDGISELRARGLLMRVMGGDEQIELSDTGLRVDTYLRRALHSPLRDANRERYGDWSQRAEALLDQPTPDIDELYRLLFEFGAALELTRRDTDPLSPPPPSDALVDRLRHKLSVMRVAELDFVLLRPAELEHREAQLPARSIIWVFGAERPNAGPFRNTVCSNIRDKDCCYLYFCSEDRFRSLYLDLESDIGAEHAARHLFHVDATPPCSVGRFYNLTSPSSERHEGWLVQWIGGPKRRGVPQGSAFYVRVDEERLSTLAERYRHREHDLLQHEHRNPRFGTDRGSL